MQVKLLRVLQEEHAEPLGSTKTELVDVRVISATSQHLEQLIESGQFRQDLYYRINVVRILIPPLREHKEDIPLLVDHFLQRLNHTMHRNVRSVHTEAMKHLIAYDYPGNIRELQNILEHALILCKEEELLPEFLPAF